MSRFVIYAVVASAAVGGTALVADALVESDSERLEQLADELGEGDGAVDAVLRWTDPAREEISVGAAGERSRVYREGDDVALSEAVTRALAPLDTSDLDVVQRSISVDGDRGTVALRARADGEAVNATVRLTRNGQGWLVTSLRVR